ncbi:unnamed protein product [Peniophora sp. CBMAI 1063]|nr:unnamed protein product [Peniophora sp. CBMAI 1063]
MSWGGFEQANRYIIPSLDGTLPGYIAEADAGMSSAPTRQLMRTHRPFHAVIVDTDGIPVLWLRRPFSWINSRMRVQRQSSSNVEDSDGSDLDTLGELAQIDEPPLSWDFNLRDADGLPIASMSKKLRGIAREIFTDTSQYYINFKPRARQLSPKERAIVLATAVNVDVDYFSRHSKGGGSWLGALLLFDILG